MSEEIIKDLKNFVEFAQKEENFTYYSEYKFNNELLVRIQGLLDLYYKEKEKNKRLREIICKLRNYSSGVVCYDKINGKDYLSPRKNFTRQQLYKQFLEMQLILKGNYIFLDNEKFLQEIEETDI